LLKGLQNKMPSMKPSIGNKDQISLDGFCNLLQSKIIGKDPIGQPIIQEKDFMVFCSRLSITRAEHATAGQLGFKPEVLLVVDSDSYDAEKHLEYNGKRYSIYKTFMRADGFTEIFCEVDANDRDQ
jgi:hypothetical protein